ncbi:MAG TPA: RraA family protein [Stellaceae bacterium]|nr:RraA family protein [Stellaceae bacterium]
MTIGFRIARRLRKVDAALVAKYKTLPLANVSDCMWRMSAGGPRLRPMHGGGVMAGPALTVKTRPGDNLMVHKAIDLAEPGDVIVVDAGGDLTAAIIGELMSTHAMTRGVAGFVIDGAIRDSAALRAGRFPVFAAGVTHRGPYKDGPGEINVAIALGGMVIAPGDLVLGDDDGVLAIPYDEAESIYAQAAAKNAAEEKQMAAIKAGTIDRSWVDASLQRLGCEFGGGK